MPLKMVYMKWFTEIKLDSFILKREKHIICQRIGLKLFSRYDENKKSKKRIWNMRIIVFLIGCLCGMSLFSLRAQQVWNPDNQNGTFTNPIMWGDWPDPDLIRVDDKFFKSKEDILDRINDRYYENLEWFSDPAKLPGRNGLEKLRHAFRHFLTDPAKREVDRLAIHHIVKNPKIALLTLESTFRDAAPYVEGMIRLGMADGSLPGVTHPHEIAEVLMLLTNVWTGMFPGSREEFAAKLRFCGEFLDPVKVCAWDANFPNNFFR